MWTHLKSEYHRDTPSALVYQLGSLCQMTWSYDETRPMSESIQK